MNPKQNDLIRRKDVLAVLEEVFDQYRMSWGEQHGGFAAAVPTAIKNIPTAYEPDKIVDELYEKAFSANDTIAVSIDDAIEIVKSGGKAE